MTMLMTSKILLSRIWYLRFSETKTKTQINHDTVHHIKNNWLGTIFFSPGDRHTKGLLDLLHPGLEGVTKVDTDPKRRFVSFNVTTSNGRVFCVYATSGHNT